MLQTVREKLMDIGINVCNIRLNGSAATHVLSDDVNPAYKDLDLIFAIDFPESDVDSVDLGNCSFQRFDSSTILNDKENVVQKQEYTQLSSISAVRPTSLITGKRTSFIKQPEMGTCDIEVSLLDDSGYTSCESSVSSAPHSPLTLPSTMSSSFLSPRTRHKRDFRPRAGSLESSSSTSSSILDDNRQQGTSQILLHHLAQHQKDQCWQEIKDTVMGILLDYLPHGVNKSKMGSCVMANAYVDKMVKVAKETDKWSLISLNNDTGQLFFYLDGTLSYYVHTYIIYKFGHF